MENRVEKDDFLFALEQTLKFYGKELDQMQSSFWWTACRNRGVASLKAALLEHVKIGKYSPRPADILTLVDTMAPQIRQSASLPPPVTTDCPPEIAKAWAWFIGKICEGSRNLDGAYKPDPLDSETQDRYVHIVNHEAHKYGMPEAIPDEYKLREVWG